jgi:hypothetical protein
LDLTKILNTLNSQRAAKKPEISKKNGKSMKPQNAQQLNKNSNVQQLWS